MTSYHKYRNLDLHTKMRGEADTYLEIMIVIFVLLCLYFPLSGQPLLFRIKHI